jgi:hypothetical protein
MSLLLMVSRVYAVTAVSVWCVQLRRLLQAQIYTAMGRLFAAHSNNTTLLQLNDSSTTCELRTISHTVTSVAAACSARTETNKRALVTGQLEPTQCYCTILE